MAGISTPALNPSSSIGSNTIADGADTAIKATVFDYTSSNPVAVRLTNTSGDYVAAGAGTQYADGDAVATPTGTIVMGHDGSNARAITVDSSGDLQVDVLTMPIVAVTGTFWQATQPVSLASVPSHAVTNAGTFAVQVDGAALTSLQLIDDTVFVDDTATHSTGSTKVIGIGAVADPTDAAITANDIGMPAMTTTRFLKVIAQANSGVDIGDVDITSIAAGDNNIGNVDIASIAAGDNNIGNVDIVSGTITTVSTVTAITSLDKAVYVDDADWTADTSSHTLVGGVTQATPSANTDGDVTPFITNALRELRTAVPESDLATAATTHVKKYYTSAGAATDGIIWSPAAGKRWYLTHLSLNVSAAATVTIEDDLVAGDSPVYKAEFAANSGVVLTFPDAPMFSGEDAADLLITTTAGNVYVTCVGYEI